MTVLSTVGLERLDQLSCSPLMQENGLRRVLVSSARAV